MFMTHVKTRKNVKAMKNIGTFQPPFISCKPNKAIARVIGIDIIFVEILSRTDLILSANIYFSFSNC
jgi:hypothetical protein